VPAAGTYFEAYCHVRRGFPPAAPVSAVLDAASDSVLREAREKYLGAMD
jgi:hypothetical protein